MSVIPSVQQDETTDIVQRNFAENASKVVSQVLAIVKRNPLNQFSTKFSLGLTGGQAVGRISDTLYLPPGAEELVRAPQRRRKRAAGKRRKRKSPGVKKTTKTKRRARGKKGKRKVAKKSYKNRTTKRKSGSRLRRSKRKRRPIIIPNAII